MRASNDQIIALETPKSGKRLGVYASKTRLNHYKTQGNSIGVWTVLASILAGLELSIARMRKSGETPKYSKI